MYNPKRCCELQSVGTEAPNDVAGELFINEQLPVLRIKNTRFNHTLVNYVCSGQRKNLDICFSNVHLQKPAG
jgi:hypothetical protein